MATTTPQLLTPGEIAERLGVSQRVVYKWIKRGTISPSFVATSGDGAQRRYGIRSTAIDRLRRETVTSSASRTA
ncbi:MAG TPA: helix-turn-helix domain-containing protein [Solirubrobacteraceae bacterium]|jgi:excisionase family DNA binding protein|nr:helix-turn-helix domain-containing protein [Solirubrobacteraceae bacterium]